MARYKVRYEGFYLIDADSADDAMETNREDCLDYEEWENVSAEMVGDTE